MKRYIDVDKFIEYLGFKNTEEERDENVSEIITLQDFDNQIVEDIQVKKLNTESGNLKKTFAIVFGLLAQTAINTSLRQSTDYTHIAPTAAQKWR